MLGEIVGRLVGHAAEAQRVAAPRSRVIHPRRGVWRWVCRHREHRIDDEVGGNDVEQRIRKAREVAQDAAAEREDQRLRHPEALEPAGERLLQRAFDDGRPNDRKRDVSVQLDHRVLGHRLGERVDVGETHRVGMHAPAFDQAVLDPTLAQTLGRPRDGGRARRPHSRLRFTAQLLQNFRPPRLLLHRAAQGRQHGRFVAPVEPRVERRFLTHESPQHPAHVRGGDVHEVWARTRGLQRFDQAGGAQQVRLCG